MGKTEFSVPPHGKEIEGSGSPTRRQPSPQAIEPAKFPTDRLESWKSIANHLGREVRTVQLWEKLEGMPVHRHFHRKLGSVFAYRSEVDALRQGLPWAPGGSVPLTNVAPTKDRIVIAVLPFESLGGNPQQEFFNDGVTVEIITALGNLSPQGLGVISRASVMAYKG